jgi:hypothetical protein
VAALGFTPAKVRHYIAAMQKTPSGASAGDTHADLMHTRYAGIDFSPPAEVRERAVEALEWRFRDGYAGGTDIGVGRALQLALEDTVPPRDVDRMVNYGSRHAVDLRSTRARRGEITPGVVAWGLWGDTEGIVWAREVAAQMRERDLLAGAGRKRKRNPAPGYQSWAWTTQDWRVVVPHRDGSVTYGDPCGAPSNRTPSGRVRLCLPVAVARALDGDPEGRRILHAQATRKERAAPGRVVRWHPVIRDLWRQLERRTEADDPRYRRKP